MIWVLATRPRENLVAAPSRDVERWFDGAALGRLFNAERELTPSSRRGAL